VLIILGSISSLVAWRLLGKQRAEKPVAEVSLRLSTERPEDVVSNFIKAYSAKDVESLAKVYSREWVKEQGFSFTTLQDELEKYLEMVEERRGKIVRWEIPKFEIYESFALAESIVYREEGSPTLSFIVLVQEDGEWKVRDIVTVIY
jgi:hypothetical protein